MTEDDATAAARRFADMSMTGLIDEWDDVMPDARRRALFDELRSRGYRTKSLAWPTNRGRSGVAVPSAGPSAGVQDEHDGERDDPSRGAILGGGIACSFAALVTGLVALATGGEGLPDQGLPGTALVVAAILYGFLALGIFKRSRVAAGLAFGGFVLDRAAVVAKTGSLAGLPVSLLIAFFLGRAFLATLAHRRHLDDEEREREGASAGLLVVLALVALVVTAVGGLLVLGSQRPTPALVTGADMDEGHLAYLRRADVLEPDETVELFYSHGLRSIAEGGLVATDRRIIAYGVSEGTSGRWSRGIRYDVITDVRIAVEGSLLGDSILRVEGRATWLEAPVPTEGGGDRRMRDFILSRLE